MTSFKGLEKEKWFSECSEFIPGQSFSLEVEEVLHEGTSDYQDLLFLKTKTFGRALVLDGMIQCTEKDEFSYQEMISFLPLCSHPNPQKVLIIGGGDGGVARDVAKHPSVESIVQCEIDSHVVELSKKYLPFMAKGYDNSKFTLHIGDGFDFMGKHKGEFDVIITDSSDPVGPAESLFQQSYYQLAFEALRPGGILCCQGENMWFHMELIKKIVHNCRQIFNSVGYAYTCIPTYPGGQIGFLLCGKSKETKFEEPLRVFTTEELDKMELRYYSSEIHRASFVLPRFAQKALASEVECSSSGCCN